MVKEETLEMLYRYWTRLDLKKAKFSDKMRYYQKKEAFFAGYRKAEQEAFSFPMSKIIAHQIHCERNLLDNGNYKRGFLDALKWVIENATKI